MNHPRLFRFPRCRHPRRHPPRSHTFSRTSRALNITSTLHRPTQPGPRSITAVASSGQQRRRTHARPPDPAPEGIGGHRAGAKGTWRAVIGRPFPPPTEQAANRPARAARARRVLQCRPENDAPRAGLVPNLAADGPMRQRGAGGRTQARPGRPMPAWRARWLAAPRCAHPARIATAVSTG